MKFYVHISYKITMNVTDVHSKCKCIKQIFILLAYDWKSLGMHTYVQKQICNNTGDLKSYLDNTMIITKVIHKIFTQTRSILKL